MRILDPKMFRKALEKQAQNKIFEYTLELKKKNQSTLFSMMNCKGKDLDEK